MYDKERGLYIAHCANGALSITGKMANMKGDLSGISQIGKMSGFIEKRLPEFGIENPQFQSRFYSQLMQKKFHLMQFFRTWRFWPCMLRLF